MEKEQKNTIFAVILGILLLTALGFYIYQDLFKNGTESEQFLKNISTTTPNSISAITPTINISTETENKNNEAMSISDIESLQKFSDIVFLIDTKHFDEWYSLQEKLASTNTNVVLQAVEQGRKSMSDYKNQMDNVIVPQLLNKSITKQLVSIKNDFQTAYSASMYYFAFIAKMVSSNDMKEIDIAWAGSQTQVEEMLKYKKKATAGLLAVSKYLQ